MTPWALGAAVVLVGSLGSSVASADTCPAPRGGDALAPVDVETRLRFLQQNFDREVADVDLWSWTWGSIYVAAGAAQATALAFIHDHGTRIDLTVGAVSAGVGALSLYGLPLRVTLPLRDARSGWGGADRCHVLADAEQALFSAADTQKLSGGWVPHAGNVVFNAALALILGWGFNRWKSAAISAGIGVVVGEANVFTQPHRMPDVLDRYLAGKLDDPRASSARAFDMALTSAGSGAGIGWIVTF